MTMIALPCPVPGLRDARHKLQVHRDASSAFAAGALGRARPQQDPPSETSARRHAGTNAAACGGNAGLRLCRPALKAWQKWLQAVPVMNGRCSMKKFSRKAFPKIFDRRTMRALPTTPRCCRGVRENGVASTRSACGFLEVAYTGRLAHQGRFGGLVRGLENDLFTRC